MRLKETTKEKEKSKYKAGDIILLDKKNSGFYQLGKKLVVMNHMFVISKIDYDDEKYLHISPISSKIEKAKRFRDNLLIKDYQYANLDKPGVIKVASVGKISDENIRKKVGTLSIDDLKSFAVRKLEFLTKYQLLSNYKLGV